MGKKITNAFKVPNTFVRIYGRYIIFSIYSYLFNIEFFSIYGLIVIKYLDLIIILVFTLNPIIETLVLYTNNNS
jgi:hypothetical protein